MKLSEREEVSWMKKMQKVYANICDVLIFKQIKPQWDSSQVIQSISIQYQ